MRLVHALIFALMLPALPGTAAPETPLTAQQFEAYVTGKTLTYAKNGKVWGTEQYLTDRKVRWAFSGEECREGYWFEEADDQRIFVYEEDGILQCWQFYHGDSGGERGLYVNDSAGVFLYGVTESPEHLCLIVPEVDV